MKESGSTLLLFLAFFHSLSQCVVLNAELDDVGDELFGQWLVERKLNGTLAGFVPLELVSEGRNARSGWKETNVGLEEPKIYEHTVLPVGGHAVADFFGGFGCCLFDDGPDLAQLFLDLFRCCCDVLFYSGSRFLSAHGINVEIRRAF